MGTTKRPATAILMTIALVSAGGCSSLRGDQVESGFSEVDGEIPIELAFTEEVEVVNPLSGYEVVEVRADAPAPEVFNFSARDAFDDTPVAGSELYGDSAMIMAFVTPSCPVCIEEGPKLANSAQLNPGIEYVIIHSAGTTEQYLEFAEATGLWGDNIRHLVDGDTSLWAHFGVLAQPSYVLVNKEGHLLSSVGALQDHGLARAAELLSVQA